MKRRLWIFVVAVAGGFLIFWHPLDAPERVFSVYNIIANFGLYNLYTEDMLTAEYALRFFVNMLPVFFFQAFVGVSFYKFFCFSSVYVFSRIPEKAKWYRKQMLSILALSFAFVLLYTISAIVPNHLSGHIMPAPGAFWISVYQVVSWTLWIFAMTMLVNFASVRWGSSTGFIAVAGMQMALVGAMLPLRPLVMENEELLTVLLRINPLSVLMSGWQSSRLFGMYIEPALEGIYALDSICIVIVICLVVLFAGQFFVVSHDILVSDAESAGV